MSSQLSDSNIDSEYGDSADKESEEENLGPGEASMATAKSLFRRQSTKMADSSPLSPIAKRNSTLRARFPQVEGLKIKEIKEYSLLGEMGLD